MSSSLSSSSPRAANTPAVTGTDLNQPPLRVQVLFSASHSAVSFPNTRLVTGSPARPGASRASAALLPAQVLCARTFLTLRSPSVRRRQRLLCLQQRCVAVEAILYRLCCSSTGNILNNISLSAAACLLILLIWGPSSLSFP